jgi:hypothetical protein
VIEQTGLATAELQLARLGRSYIHVGNAGASPDSLNDEERPRKR